MEWSVKTFSLFFSNGCLGVGGGLFRIKAGAEAFVESNDTCVTGANTFSSPSFDSGFRLHENSRHTIARTTETRGWIVIEPKGILKKQKKFPLPYFRTLYYRPFFQVFNFSNGKFERNFLLGDLLSLAGIFLRYPKFTFVHSNVLRTTGFQFLANCLWIFPWTPF